MHGLAERRNENSFPFHFSCAGGVSYTLEARSECVKSMEYVLVWRADPLVGWPLLRDVYEAIPNVPQKKKSTRWSSRVYAFTCKILICGLITERRRWLRISQSIPGCVCPSLELRCSSHRCVEDLPVLDLGSIFSRIARYAPRKTIEKEREHESKEADICTKSNPKDIVI